VVNITTTVTSDGTDVTPADNSMTADTAVSETFCDDGNLCTVDGCDQAGTQCEFIPMICTALDSCHKVGICDPGSGICSNPVSPNGTLCDDGDLTTCGDSCTDGACAGGFVPEPAEIDNSLRLSRSGGMTTLAWDDPPGEFNVYEGSIVPGSPFDFDHTCVNPGGPVTTMGVDLPGDPPPTEVDYYLVTRIDQCRESSTGRDSIGTPRVDLYPCSAGKALP